MGEVTASGKVQGPPSRSLRSARSEVFRQPAGGYPEAKPGSGLPTVAAHVLQANERPAMSKAEPEQTHVAKEISHERPWISCRFNRAGTAVYAGCEDFRVWRVDLASDAKLAFPTQAWVRALALPNDELLLTGGYDGRLIWWPAQADKPEPLRTVAAHDGWIRALALHPDGQRFATCGNDGHVRIWSLADGSLLHDLTGHARHVYNVAFHPAGTELISGDLVSRFLQWDVASGKQVREFTIATLHKYDAGFLADYGGPFSIAFAPDGKSLACGGITNVTNAFAGVGNPAVSEIDWQEGKERVAHLSKGNVQGTAWGLAWHPDQFLIAATGGPGGGHLFFWRPGEKDEFQSVNLGNVARDLDLHGDGLRIVTAHHDRKLRLSLMAPKPA